MPVKIKSLGDHKYKVSTPSGTKAKHTTLKKAKSQQRLINAVDHGWVPTGKAAKKSRHEAAQRISHQADLVIENLLTELQKEL